MQQLLEWDVADRMRKSLRVSNIAVQEIADYLDVARNTVSTWINGRIVPSTQTLRLWALRTGVSYDWLRTGQVTPGTGPDDGGNQVTDEYPQFPGHQFATNISRLGHVSKTDQSAVNWPLTLAGAA